MRRVIVRIYHKQNIYENVRIISVKRSSSFFFLIFTLLLSFGKIFAHIFFYIEIVCNQFSIIILSFGVQCHQNLGNKNILERVWFGNCLAW